MVNPPFPEQIDALPIRVRPRPGELADSFICRLARANHIKPSYLHGLVHGPPLWAGAPKIGRLALFSGISEAVLERTLLRVATSLVDIKSADGQSEEEDARQRLHFRIRRDADGRGLTVRALAERHNVSRRTVRRALNAPEPPPDLLIRRIPARVEPLKPVIDPMLMEGLAPKQIWVRLIDDHSIALHFDRIVHYARAWHLARIRPEHPPLIQFPSA
ncbi:TniQ family protein [Streptomyces sp. NPDC017248]|uniref:TniQ family protein n=1 Tax=unclassified Streptomyces TaxID=2593676 RepID=UPI0037A2C945